MVLGEAPFAARAESVGELARHYLQHSSLELNETAYLLGYEDANSFFRAFQQWEGASPASGVPGSRPRAALADRESFYALRNFDKRARWERKYGYARAAEPWLNRS